MRFNHQLEFLRRPLVLALWLVALWFPAYVSADPAWPAGELSGLYCLVFGAFAPFSPDQWPAFFAWLANLFLAVHLIFLRSDHPKRRAASTACLLFGACLALFCLWVNDFPVGRGELGPRDWRPGLGLYLWLSSFAMAGIFLLVQNLSRFSSAGLRFRFEKSLLSLIAAGFLVSLVFFVEKEMHPADDQPKLAATEKRYVCEGTLGLELRADGRLWMIEPTPGRSGRTFRLLGMAKDGEIHADSESHFSPAEVDKVNDALKNCHNSAGAALSARFKVFRP